MAMVKNQIRLLQNLLKNRLQVKKIYLYKSHQQVNLIHASDVANFILFAIKTKKKLKVFLMLVKTLYL